MTIEGGGGGHPGAYAEGEFRTGPLAASFYSTEVTMRLVWHWLIWFTPPWGRNVRRRAVLEQVERWQAQERRLAFGRIENYTPVWTFGPPTLTPPGELSERFLDWTQPNTAGVDRPR